MTPAEREAKNALDRAYAADLLERRKRAPCPVCGAPRGKPCIRGGKPKAGVHWQRAYEANVRGYVKGPDYWRHRRGWKSLAR